MQRTFSTPLPLDNRMTFAPLANSISPETNTIMPEEVFDYEAALQRCGGHPGPLRRYVDLLEGEYRQLLASAEQCIARKDAHGLKRAAYKLGWHASNLSASSTLDSALHLESIGRTGDLQDASKALCELEKELERLRSAISAISAIY